jgi:uncharacterized protein (DUF2141 family)
MTRITVRTFHNILSLIVTASFAAFTLPAAAQESAPATLSIHVQNVAPEGIVRLGLYTEAQYPDDNSTPVMSADVPAVGGETVITLKNVPVGTYAIEVFQDLNSNGKMDSNFLGLPKEPYGFSRDAHPRLSKPDFSRVKFEVAAGQNDQSLHLQNTVSLVASN